MVGQQKFSYLFQENNKALMKEDTTTLKYKVAMFCEEIENQGLQSNKYGKVGGMHRGSLWPWCSSL